jgi:hypothetical protein
MVKENYVMNGIVKGVGLEGGCKCANPGADFGCASESLGVYFTGGATSGQRLPRQR